jgi:serine/threonine-protein kinase SRPK2
LCWDTTGKHFVALKIVKSAEHYTEAALDEIKLLQAVCDADPDGTGRKRVVELLDQFNVTGINGTHVCMVFEVLGCNLLKLIIRTNYEGLPLEQVRIITRQVLEGLHHLHEKCQIIHTDIKPENVLITMSHEQIRRMAGDAILCGKMGMKMSGSAVCTAPRSFTQKMEASISKSKKKKLKKKRKKQRELLEQQLLEMEGLTVDTTETTLDEKMDIDDARNVAQNSPPPYLFEQKLPTIPRVVTSSTPTAGKASEENEVTSPHDSTQRREALNLPLMSDSQTTPGSSPLSPATPLTSSGKKKKSKAAQKEKRDDSPSPPSGREAADGDLSAEESEDDDSAEDSAMVTSQVQDVEEVVNNGRVNGSVKPRKKRTSLTPMSETEVKANMEEESKAQSSSNQTHPLYHMLATSPFASPRGDEDDRLPTEPQEFSVKIADLGNACWVHHHFTEDIQTRQYRALEVIIGAGYGPPADIWSTACMAFELATGDYLFEPHSGSQYSRDEDHLAHVIELLGSIPPTTYKKGEHWREFFGKNGRLMHIPQLKPWSLVEVLTQKYCWPFEQARSFAAFLLPMLAYEPSERATAAHCLKHPWLNKPKESAVSQQASSPRPPSQ